MPAVIEIPRDHNPFPMTGVSRDANGIPRYTDLPATLLDMLAEQVDREAGGLKVGIDSGLLYSPPQ